jgi:predicted nucleic acid-binding protein
MRIGSGTRAGKSPNELSAGYQHLLSSLETPRPSRLIVRIENDLLTDVTLLDFDSHCAKRFGEVRGQLLQRGISVSRIDLLIASVALAHNLTMVTDNTADFQNIPGLRLENWLEP